jgi:hypothetical protein
MGNPLPKIQAQSEIIKQKYIKFSIHLKSGPIDSCQSLLYSSSWVSSQLELFHSTLTFSKSQSFQVNDSLPLISRNQPLLEMLLLSLVDNAKVLILLKFDSSKDFADFTRALLLSKRPSWSMSPVCQVCCKRFGVVSRTHHCRSCGNAICGQCSQLSRLDMYGYVDNQRVCVQCPRKIEEIVGVICELRQKDLKTTTSDNLYDLPFNQSLIEPGQG